MYVYTNALGLFYTNISGPSICSGPRIYFSVRQYRLPEVIVRGITSIYSMEPLCIGVMMLLMVIEDDNQVAVVLLNIYYKLLNITSMFSFKTFYYNVWSTQKFNIVTLASMHLSEPAIHMDTHGVRLNKQVAVFTKQKA